MAGSANSSTETIPESSVVFFDETFVSEQIQIGLIASSASAVHAMRVWERSEMLGTKKRILPFPLVIVSASLSDVNVLPLPQAIISLPLSLIQKC